MADPFDFSGQDPNNSGFLGVSPSAWQHLAMFGGNLAQAANARTSGGFLANGAGFAGPLGAAITDTGQQSMVMARNQSQLRSQGLQNQHVGMENQLLASQLPLQQAQNAQNLDMIRNPQKMLDMYQTLMGGSAGGVPSIGPQGAAGTFHTSSTNADPNVVHRLESGGSMAPGIVGDGGLAAGPMQVHQAALDDVNTANGTKYSMQDLTANPEVGKWVGASYLALQQKRFPGNPAAQLAAYNAGPTATANAIMGGQGLASLPPSAQGYVQHGLQSQFAGPGAPTQGGQPQTPGQPPQMPAGGMMTPQQALELAHHYQRQAGVVEFMQKRGLPMPGDPASLRQASQTYLDLALSGPKAAMTGQAGLPTELAKQGFQQNRDGSMAPIQGGQADPGYKGSVAAQEAGAKAGIELGTAGPIAAQKSMNSNVDLRPGGMAGLVGPDGQRTFLKNPGVIETQDTQGNTVPMHASPAMPGEPAGTAGEATPILGPDGKPVITKLPANVQHARDKAYTEFAGKDADSFVAATNTQGLLTQMNQAADELNRNRGFMNTGPLAPERMAFASKVNDITNTFGLGRPFDPNAVGAWEELIKATKTAGFELASHYEGHARQAAQTIENATSAVPSEVNSPIGFQKVSAGVNEIAQQTKDAHAFAKQPVYDQNGDLVKAETDFYTKFPAQMYARRAISTTQPYEIKSTDQAKAMQEMSRYLPGTFVKLANNKIIQVPGRPDAPPVPDYLQHYTPQAGTPQ